jgi:hypothetical protein
MAVKGLRNLCRAPYIYLVVFVILLIMILAGMMFYKNSKEGFKEGANSDGNSSQECDPPCGNINNQKTCLATPASTPSGNCYWNQSGRSIDSHPFRPYCATSIGTTSTCIHIA